MKLKKTCLGVSALLLTSHLSALTLQESVVEAMDTNPVVQERLKNYRATQQDLNIAESEYYPKLDFSAAVGFNKQGMFKNSAKDWNHKVLDNSYGNYETQLKFTQNLFDGFGTTHKIDYQEARILAAAYNYIEKTNDIAFKMTNAYFNVLRSYELLQTAHENVEINEDIYNKVQELYNAGLTADSEVKKIQSALSLAHSNLTVQKNNTRDAEYNFKRVLGRMPDIATLYKPELNIPMPDSLERATLYAINHNPSLLVSRYNIKGAQALWKQHEKEYYPTVDLEVSQTYNDVQDLPAIDQADDRFKARIVLNYNLFRGGADSASVQKDISKINQEIEIKRDLKRQVIEGIELSWSAYEMILLQLKDLKEYSGFSEKTLELYKEEYDLGRRSLLDLLSAQNDVINARTQIINAEYDQLFARYRVLDAMGLLPLAVIGDTSEFTSVVNLYSDDNAQEVLDSIPVKFDVDNDNIADNEDLCDNSLLENNIMPYGCKKVPKDSDFDGVFDFQDKCLTTPKGVAVDPSGCALDNDHDGIKDYKDECLDTPFGDEVDILGCTIEIPDSDKDGIDDSKDQCQNTPIGYKVDNNGCTSSITLKILFPLSSAKLPKDVENKVAVFSQYLKDNPEYNIKIVGHTSYEVGANAAYNMKLSKQRARSLKNALVKEGIDSKRIVTDGKGFSEPVADNSTYLGRVENRRLEIELSKKGTK